jgi:hypothetical protein
MRAAAVIVVVLVASLVPPASASAAPRWKKAALRQLKSLRPVYRSKVTALKPMGNGRLGVTMELSTRGSRITRPRTVTRSLTLEPGRRVQLKGGIRSWLAHPLYVETSGNDGVVFTRVRRQRPGSGQLWLTWRGRPAPLKTILRQLRDDRRLSDDEPTMVNLVRHFGRALRVASARLRGKASVVRAAIEQDPQAIVHALPPASNDRELWRSTLRRDPAAIAHAPGEIRNDARVVGPLAEAAPEDTIPYLPYRFRADPAFMLRVVKKDGRALRFASKAVRADPEVALAAIRQCPQAAAFVAPELLQKPAFQREARRRWRARRALAGALETAGRFRSSRGAGRWTPSQVLEDFDRFARAHPRAVITTAFAEADALEFHRITGGRALPSDFIAVYDRALAMADAGVRVENRALAVGPDKVSWDLGLKGPSGQSGSIKCSYDETGTVHHGLIKFSAGVQGRGLMPLLSIAHDNLYLRLGVKRVTLTAGLTAGPYVWARNFFGAAPDRLAEIKQEFVDFLGKRDSQLRAAGVTPRELKALRTRIESTNRLWELAGERIPGKQIQVGDCGSWGLHADHKPGGYEIGKLFFLSKRPSYKAEKDYSHGRRGVQVRLGRKRHLRAAIKGRIEGEARYSDVKAIIRELNAL